MKRKIKKKNCMNTDTKKIEVSADETEIIYTLKLDNSKHYFSYNAVLLGILKKNELSPFRNGARLRFRIAKNGDEVKIYGYDLGFAVYHGWITDADRYLTQYRAYAEDKQFFDKTIDHADGHVQNNTVWNLSVMTRGENTRKGTIISKVKEPFSLNSVYTGDGYRVRLHYGEIREDALKYHAFRDKRVILDGNLNAEAYLRFWCESAEEYVACLRWLTELKPEWSEPMRIKKKWLNQGGACRVGNIRVSMDDQREILNEKSELYQPFSKIEVPKK